MVDEILHSYKSDARMQNGATVALQEAAQAYLVGLFEEANLVALHSKRTTVIADDVKLIRRLHGEGRKNQNALSSKQQAAPENSPL